MAKTICYIDGFNLYHALDSLDNQRVKWLNLWVLAETLMDSKKDELLNVKFFTALCTWDKEKRKRHLNYIKALEHYKVQVIKSKFKSQKKTCWTTGNNCKKYVEKQTDVAIATHMIDNCYQGISEKIILITADSDQVPATSLIKKRFPHIKLVLVAPPNRASKSQEIRELADTRREIQVARLSRCLLPIKVLNKKLTVIAECPEQYLLED